MWYVYSLTPHSNPGMGYDLPCGTLAYAFTPIAYLRVHYDISINTLKPQYISTLQLVVAVYVNRCSDILMCRERIGSMRWRAPREEGQKEVRQKCDESGKGSYALSGGMNQPTAATPT
jgi:hypothetical protein